MEAGWEPTFSSFDANLIWPDCSRSLLVSAYAFLTVFETRCHLQASEIVTIQFQRLSLLERDVPDFTLDLAARRMNASVGTCCECLPNVNRSSEEFLEAAKTSYATVRS